VLGKTAERKEGDFLLRSGRKTRKGGTQPSQIYVTNIWDKDSKKWDENKIFTHTNRKDR